ncbi:MAG: acylneuraminate cytidylyltransferase family protein [Planctomycetota bacterium]|jgi:CMP-N-acetylneuraminic acid synthetase
MSALALIMARAGSKGVPGKNIAPIAGRPCICWSIDHARESRLVSRIAITTDDPEIQQLGLELGIDIVARPATLAEDDATIDDAARHAIDSLAWNEGPIALLYANVPVRPRGLLDRAVDMLLTTGCDSVQSFTSVGKHHPLWTARLDEDARAVPWQGETLNNNIFRRQDLPPAYIPDGGVLVCQKQALLLEDPGLTDGPHAFLGRDRRGVETEPGEVIDIDTPTDQLIADVILRAEHPQPRTPSMP